VGGSGLLAGVNGVASLTPGLWREGQCSKTEEEDTRIRGRDPGTQKRSNVHKSGNKRPKLCSLNFVGYSIQGGRYEPGSWGETASGKRSGCQNAVPSGDAGEGSKGNEPGKCNAELGASTV